MKLFDLRHHSTEHLSQRILYIATGLATALFALYYMVGYDRAYAEDPDFNEPLLTTALLGFVYGMVAVVVGVTLWAVWREIRCRKDEPKVTNGIPAAWISRSVAGATLAVLVLTFVLGSTQPVVTNGVVFADSVLLRVADQFIYTATIMLVAAALAVVYGMTRYYRKQNIANANQKKAT